MADATGTMAVTGGTGSPGAEERFTLALESLAIAVRAFVLLVTPVLLPDLPDAGTPSRRPAHLRRIRAGRTTLPVRVRPGYLVLDCRRQGLTLHGAPVGTHDVTPPAKRTQQPA